MNLVIRKEQTADIEAIRNVTIAAFKSLEISNQTEHFIIEALRVAGALELSLVAELGGRVVGHIAFSPLKLSDNTPGWFGLGPVSVIPECQRKGIGRKLIEIGLERLKAQGAQGCCLVGHPEYYRKFGFNNPSELSLEGIPEEFFFALSFTGGIPKGTVEFHEAFKAEAEMVGGGEGTRSDGTTVLKLKI